MSQSLFTSQTPISGNNSDGTPGITTATTVTFAQAGTVSGIRFYSTTTVSGTYTVALYRVDTADPGGSGTQLASATAGIAPTGGTWNTVMFSSPVSVVVGGLYRASLFSGAGRYVSSSNFFTSGGGGLVNGDITAPPNLFTDPTVGQINQGTFVINAALAYPTDTFNATCYFVDVLFDPAGTEQDLSAALTATGSMSAALTAERPLSAALVATGGLSAALTAERSLSAALTATGGMSVTLASEVHLSAALTATAGMSVAGTVETSLRANLTAAAGMSAALTVPVLGPVDPIGTPVALELLSCFTDQLQELVSPPKYIQLRVGQETGPLIGANIDECCAGLAWIRIANIYPSWDSFPAADNTWLPCGPLAYAVVLEMGVAFCMPWSDSDESFDNVDPPNAEDWSAAFATQMQHQTLMRRSAACCWRPTQRRAVGEWSPLPVEGGCTGGKMTVTVSVPAPCADC